MKRLLVLLALLPITASAMDKIAEVEHSSTSVILRFPLYDAAAPEQCASDVTVSTSGLQINVSTDVTDGYYDQYQQSDSTLEAITTIGTYSAPSATKARFEIIATGACTYELHLPDAAFAVSNATILTIAVTDGGTQILDDVFWVDLTPVSQSTLVDTLLGTSCDSPGAGTLEEQWCSDVDAILTDTGTTLDSRQQTINNNTSYNIITAETADSGSTTTLVDADNLAGLGDDLFNNGAAIYVDISTGVEGRCVTDYVSASNQVTVFPAFSAAVSTETYTLVADPGCRNEWDEVVEDQGSQYNAREVLSILLSEAAGTCVYNSTTRVWTCKDPGGNETRLVITMGSELDGDRDSVTLTPVTP